MEWVGLLAGIVVIGYVIFLLILPFSVSALFRRIGELESKIRVLEDGEQRLRTALARLKSAPQDSLVSEAQPSEDSAQGAPSVEEEAGEPRPATEPPTPPKERLASTGGVAVSDPWLAPRVSASGAAADGASPTLPALFDKLKTWLLGGNTVARVGVIVLFLGVAFLLKYASERGWLPIEMRLMATALGGIGLILIGWRLRTKRRNYGLVLQGGGTGIVYLTVFAAANMYQLVPAGPGLVLMVVLVALSSALAVLQDARSLAFLATVGGFLGPVLLSRGGSHVALFAYYAVLDAGILAIAWFKAWRELNLVGFVFTFVIGSIWGFAIINPNTSRPLSRS